MTSLPIINNENGLGLVSLLILTPILLSLTLGLATFFYSLKVWKQQHHICRTQVIKLQRELALSLNQIMTLNKPAQALQLKEKLVRAALLAAKAAKNPPAIAAAKTALAIIKNKQIKLGLMQKKWFGMARLNWAKSNLELRKLIAETQNVGSVVSVKTQGPRPLALIARKPHPRAPVYDFTPHFTDTQSIEITWKAHLLSQLPNTVTGLRFENILGPLNFQVRCRATLRSEEKKWKVRLMNEARPSLSLSL